MFIAIHRLNLPLLIVLFVFAMPLGGWYLSEALHARRGQGSPLVEGMVLKRKEYRRFGGIPAGRLTVQIVEAEVVVVANVNKAALERFGRRVRFHYTGDPAREVFLEGEEDPLWAAVFLLGTPVVLLGAYLKLKGKPGFEHVIG